MGQNLESHPSRVAASEQYQAALGAVRIAHSGRRRKSVADAAPLAGHPMDNPS